MGRHLEITESELRILRMLEKKINKGYKVPVRATATELRLATHTIYTTLDRIRRRYNLALIFGSQYREWRRKLGNKFL